MNAKEFVLSLMGLARRKGCIALASFTDQHCGLPGCRKFHPRNILVARPNGTLEAWWNQTPLHSNVEFLDASQECSIGLAAQLAEEWLKKAREVLSSPLLTFEDILEQARLDMEARPWVFAYLDFPVGEDKPIGYVDYPSGYRLAIVSAESPEFEQELPQGSLLLFGPFQDPDLGWMAVVALPPEAPMVGWPVEVKQQKNGEE